MSAAAFKEERERHWQMPVTVFRECIKPFFVTNTCFYFTLLHSCQAGLWGFMIQVWHYLAHHFLGDTGHHSHSLPACQWPMKQWPFVLQIPPRVIFCHDLQHTPPAMVAFRCVAHCDSCCRSLYYSSRFCKQQICDGVPSTVVTSPFISPAYVVWYGDAFFIFVVCLQSVDMLSRRFSKCCIKTTVLVAVLVARIVWGYKWTISA